MPDTKNKNLKSQCPSVLAIENPLSRGLLRVEADTLTHILKSQCPSAFTIEHSLYRGLLKVDAGGAAAARDALSSKKIK